MEALDQDRLFPDRPVRVAVTGAAGQIGYALLPFICSGRMFGAKQPVELKLLEIPPAMTALGGVVMELHDCAFPLLENVVSSDDPMVAFKDVDVAVLVGSFPRKAGMERQELLSKNGSIFKEQGNAINDVASPDVKILVVGNPANTNALILKQFARRVPSENISAMTRLDHNRTVGMVASKLGKQVDDVSNVIVWGNHSATQYPDVSIAQVKGVSGSIREALGGEEELKQTTIPAIQKRGAEIIAARKLSSAMSAAYAACDCIRDWLLGTGNRMVSMAVRSDGSYGTPEGVWFSFPVICTRGGGYSIVQGIELDDFSRSFIEETSRELASEQKEAMSLFE